nr:MAG TPA: hypothetical protein [Bacteriophage sp.]
MVQVGLRKRLILLGGQYPDHVLHSFAGPAPPLPFHAIAVEPVIRFCSTQVDFCMDAGCRAGSGLGYREHFFPDSSVVCLPHPNPPLYGYGRGKRIHG